jgi:hypothetical protein
LFDAVVAPPPDDAAVVCAPPPDAAVVCAPPPGAAVVCAPPPDDAVVCAPPPDGAAVVGFTVVASLLLFSLTTHSGRPLRNLHSRLAGQLNPAHGSRLFLQSHPPLSSTHLPS